MTYSNYNDDDKPCVPQEFLRQAVDTNIKVIRGCASQECPDYALIRACVSQNEQFLAAIRVLDEAGFTRGSWPEPEASTEKPLACIFSIAAPDEDETVEWYWYDESDPTMKTTGPFKSEGGARASAKRCGMRLP